MAGLWLIGNTQLSILRMRNLQKKNNKGIWQGNFENPWDFRKKN